MDLKSSNSVLEADRDSHRTSAEKYHSQLTEALASITDLKEKVRTGEDVRKKLHNKVLELKVRPPVPPYLYCFLWSAYIW